ncbi:ArsR/SmtB family transcription factor [Glutamicibacter halophytocola]|uniref:Metalloregulator ArsR/SmtB family transcription factor n=1 Tax=Glutamicibacter halophytocola TaxID=1933880 RepID=A0AA95BUA8_9MICC|nr:metalloregulator ArsR/SmtB family transcription factor [Glutamicibacter halophytocola]UUX59608.1 metalloregulator ArsR/SmtB family transcription factor [Glutamicibacter halophytocola]
MAMIESRSDDLLDRDGKMRQAALFHALADPTRLLILEHLKTGEHKVRELTDHLGLAQSTVSAHLACLRDTDLVTVRSQGRASIYTLGQAEYLDQLLSLAQQLVPNQSQAHHWQEAHSSQQVEV